MPSKSVAQHNLMEGVAHNPKLAAKVGIPQSVGQDFADADAGKKVGALPKKKPNLAMAKARAAAMRKPSGGGMPGMGGGY